MVLALVLNILSLCALIIAISAFARLHLKKSRKRQVVILSLSAAIVLSLSVCLVCAASLIQEKASVDLGLPADLSTKARIWVKNHPSQPDPKKVTDNINLISDGITFYRANSGRFPAEAKLQMQELSRIPLKLDHLLSFGEEQHYFRAAQGVMAIIKGIAESQSQSPSADKNPKK
jgi:hypothetical protein